MGEIAVLEYMIHEVKGVPIEQKNVFGCLVKDDAYADIHLSKSVFKPADRPLLMTILSSASFAFAGPSETADNSLTTSSAPFFADGCKYFAMEQYDKAIGPYQEALALEKQEQRLDQSKWRVLIDNLAMAYGMTGKLNAADEVVKYGLTKDPTYPMFYFILADSYAERNDLDNAMKYLRLALLYKDNVTTGEALPDPGNDDSFRRFRDNNEFKKLAERFK